MLSQLFAKKNKQELGIQKLFEQEIHIAERAQNYEPIKVETKEENLEDNSDPERKNRTVFVGNLELNTTKKEVKELFSPYGTIEKLWFRSVPVNRDQINKKSKIPIKAAIILGKFKEGAKSKNCYVLLSDIESATKAATKLDGLLYKDLHLRCNLETKKTEDFSKTAFVGNLPFNIEEEEVRSEFEQFGPIRYVRLIRDPVTHNGKGFGYVCFEQFISLKNALQAGQLNISGRDLRISKAVKPALKQDQKLQNNPKNANQRIINKQKQKRQTISNKQGDTNIFNQS